ncbi:MAG: hypothetical protein ABSH51_22920 [Solirubrobacteraceae bacterium]
MSLSGAITPGTVAPELRAEFPGLRLDWLALPARPRPSPPELVARLRALSDRFRGASAVTMRATPVPRAFRTFFRQIGLDPDVDRPPGERAAVARLLHGGFRSVDAIGDACLVALVETGVPVWALDADAVDPLTGLGIRAVTAADGPGAGPAPRPAPAGTLAVADGARVHAVLFGDPLPGSAVRRSTTRVALFSLAVDGVPTIHVEEALWICAEIVGGGAAGW